MKTNDPTLQQLSLDMLEAVNKAEDAYFQYFQDCLFTGVPVFSPDPTLAYMIYKSAIERENDARFAFNAYASVHCPDAVVAATRP